MIGPAGEMSKLALKLAIVPPPGLVEAAGRDRELGASSPADLHARGGAVAAVAAKDIQLVTSGGAQAAAAECTNAAATRNIAIRKSCSTGYAAALLTIEEVR